MTANPRLTLADSLCSYVAGQAMTAEDALAELRVAGMVADRDILAEAVAALQLWTQYRDGLGDPYSYIEVSGPRTDLPDARETAIYKAERAYFAAVLRLLNPAEVTA